LEDAPFLNSFVQKCFVDESQYVLDEGILFGDGLKQPLGIMNSGALLTIAKESGQTAVLDPLNIVKMFARIFPASSPKATVVINPEIYEYLPTLTLTSGANSYPLFLPPGGFSQMPFGSVYGRKLIPIEHCPAPKTTGDIIAADFSQYLLLRKGDNRLDASMHWAFDTDEWAFRIILRVGGRPLWDKAVTPAKGTSGVKYSPFVCLGAR
jgi:HK97 family phage major capsid protein